MNRSKWQIEQKLSIVLEGLKDSAKIVEICRKYGVSQSQYYRWRDLFLEGGKIALERGKISKSEQQLQNRLSEYEQIIGKQAIEIQILKKTANLLK